MIKVKSQQAMSLLEVLVVVAIFAILGIVVTQAVLLTLRGSKKSESQVKVRENLSYSMAVIERQLRNADSITPCPNPDINTLDYLANEGVQTSFSCVGVGGADGYVASGSARLTSNEVNVTNCFFICETATAGNPPSVTVSLEAKETGTAGIESSKVTTTTKVNLRTY